MGRPLAILQSQFPYTISARCINKEWFHLDIDHVWDIFCDELLRTTEKFSWQIHSFVLMSNHFHLIATTPEANISECMHSFMGLTSRKLSKSGRRINETFAGRHYKCILNHHNYYLNAYKYNYRNPVAAGLAERVENYKYSTLPMIMGHQKTRFPLVEDTTYLSDPIGTIEWLNNEPDKIKWEAAKLGFRRVYFESRKDEVTKRPILEESDRL